MTGWGDPLLFGSRNGGRVCREKLGIGSPAAPLSLGKVARPHVGGGGDDGSTDRASPSRTKDKLVPHSQSTLQPEETRT